MNEALFRMTVVVLWLAAWSAAAVLRLGLSDAPRQSRRLDGGFVWYWGWSSVTTTEVRSPADAAWAGGSLTAAWLAVLALPVGVLRPESVSGLQIPSLPPLLPCLGLLLVSDWLSRLSRRSDDQLTIPWQGWCGLAACAAPAAWVGPAQMTDRTAIWAGLWFSAAAAVWCLACCADLQPAGSEPGLSRLAGVLRRWILFGLGIAVFWGGGDLPGLPTAAPLLSGVVVLAKLAILEVVLSQVVPRWRPGSWKPGAWLIAMLTGIVGGPLTAALIETLGKDQLLTALLQGLLLVCGVLLARMTGAANSPGAARDSGAAVG